MKRIISLFGMLLLLTLPVFAQSEDVKADGQPEVSETTENNEQKQENASESEDSGNSEENPDEDENYVRKDDGYKTNGKGDQYLKIGIMGNFPLNFGDKLYTGGSAEIGYYRFLNSWLGVGGELMAGYNPTLGSNVLTFLPVTFGCVFQPSVWRFEFPITATVGFAFETCANKKYFPGFAAKAETGAYFRITEGWSAGLFGQFLYLPEWYTTTDNADSDYGMFMQAGISARYHF